MRAVPPWAWVLALAVAAIEPLTHLWIAYFPPEGMVPTGLHTGDSHVYLNAMRMFQTGFHSPYAWDEPHDWRYYALPTHFFYGALGVLASLLHVPHFIALGLFNGLFGFFYLIAAYGLLRTVAPRVGGMAFALFALGGGLGGILYILSGLIGLHDASQFETYFARHAAYDLIEGAHLWPVLHMPRAYYTLALGLGFLAFASVARNTVRSKRLPAEPYVLLLMAQLINMRVGTFIWAMIAVYVICAGVRPFAQRMRTAAALFIPILAGGAATFALLRIHPAYAQNVYGPIAESMWFSALLSAIVVHLVVAAPEFVRSLRALTGILRVLACLAAGYLVTWVILYVAYQVYFGNYVLWIDVTSAIIISDWALLGTPLFGYIVHRLATSKPHDGKLDDTRWAVVWVLLAVAVGISAWGQGAFMGLLPRRLLVVIGLPLCLITAAALVRLNATRPWIARAALGIVLLCGVSTVLVAALTFQGPLGRTPGQGPFARIHYEGMTPADAELLAALPGGRVLAPMFNPFSFTEVIALQDGNSVVAGVGTLNHSGVAFEPIKENVINFFESKTDNEWRREFLESTEADFVYCPDTCPVSPDVIAALRAMPKLREISAADKGVIFEVDLSP